MADNRDLYLNICSYMDDEIREYVHCLMAPCTAQEYIDEYVKHDTAFVDFVKDVFGIDLMIDKIF